MTDRPNMPHHGHLVDARLHLLDRQILGDDDDPIGIVDDLELTDFPLDTDIPAGTQPPRVTGILSGRVVATRILGGAPPRSRLPEIPWNLVHSVGTVIKLKPTDMSFDVDWVERWLCDRIFKHIPGGRHAAE
jgi:hypothetical protein